MEITDKKLYEIMMQYFNEYGSVPVDANLLIVLFQSSDGNIYFNEREKVAIGFYADGATLRFAFFEILEDRKLKCVGERGISLNEFAEPDMLKAISACIAYRKSHGEALDTSVDVTHYHG